MAGPALENGRLGAAKPKLMADINITPMVDVMLVLLVIFMVSAPLLVAGVHVDLPRNAAPKLSHLQKPVIVTLAADGGLYLGDESVQRGDILARLSASVKASAGDATVYVRADRKIGYGDVLELLGVVGQAGYQKISLLSQPLKAAFRRVSHAGSGSPWGRRAMNWTRLLGLALAVALHGLAVFMVYSSPMANALAEGKGSESFNVVCHREPRRHWRSLHAGGSRGFCGGDPLAAIRRTSEGN